ncbi:MAG: histone H1 [Ignavibacteriae bacterium]|nr:histone H1 [Ignavibacteriota bacterium]MCB9214963.1 histone H1 [Ignavibacteria bacterium]
MADRYQQLKDLIDSFEQDFQKFYDKQNKAAGVRVRKHMQELRQLAQDIRGEVQDMKSSWDSQG